MKRSTEIRPEMIVSLNAQEALFQRGNFWIARNPQNQEI
jgi:hypothetical protein